MPNNRMRTRAGAFAAKRAAVFVFDAVCVAALSAIVCLGCATPAYAYVDPSVMTYTIQALAGVAVALSAVLGVAMRRTRKALMKMLNIDENARKIVESDVHRVTADGPVDETGAPIKEAAHGAGGVRKVPSGKRKHPAHAVKPVGLSWPKRLVIALIASVFTAGTVFFVAPSEIMASNSSSLIFGLADVWSVILVMSAVIAGVLALVVSLVRGRAFSIVIGIVVALGVGAYVQVMFMNASLPTADGSSINWADYSAITVISAVVWIALIAGAVVLCAKRASIGRGVAMVISVALIVVQGVGVASLWVAPPGGMMSNQKELHVTKEGLFDVSQESNVIVFVLDMFDTRFMLEDINEDPSVLAEMTGFTLFDNSTGSMIPTRYGVPYLLTGEMPRQGESFDEFTRTRYQRSSFIDDIAAQNYSIGIYSDSVLEGQPHIADKTVNIHQLGQAEIDKAGTARILMRCALYRDAPWALKRFFWFYTDEMNTMMTLDDTSAELGSTPYEINDRRYYEELQERGLRVVEDGSDGAFRFIHLLGPHWPCTLNENAEFVGEGNSDYLQQSRASLTIVSEYLRQLKELGIYDQSTIIITADHGEWWLSDGPIEVASNPLMLVKPAGTSEDSARPCRVSHAPTGHVDYPATVIDAVGGDSSAYGPTVFEVPEGPRTRYFCWTNHDGKIDHNIIQYAIDGDANDIASWSLTGTSWYYGR